MAYLIIIKFIIIIVIIIMGTTRAPTTRYYMTDRAVVYVFCKVKTSTTMTQHVYSSKIIDRQYTRTLNYSQ